MIHIKIITGGYRIPRGGAGAFFLNNCIPVVAVCAQKSIIKLICLSVADRRNGP